jgi:polar amino acid transport system permease protein
MSGFGNTFFNAYYMLQVLPDIIKLGIWNTLTISIGATVIGVLIGAPLSLLSASKVWLATVPAKIYIDIFRGLPTIVTIFLIGQGLPLSGMHLFGQNSYPYGILAIGIVASAYIAEILRSGIQSVERGQLEAARALGLSHSSSMVQIIFPQGLRRVLPALTNQFINTIKDSSLIFILGLSLSQREVYLIGQNVAQQTGNLSPLTMAGLAYLTLTVPLTYFVNFLDKRLREGKRTVVSD